MVVLFTSPGGLSNRMALPAVDSTLFVHPKPFHDTTKKKSVEQKIYHNASQQSEDWKRAVAQTVNVRTKFAPPRWFLSNMIQLLHKSKAKFIQYQLRCQGTDFVVAHDGIHKRKRPNYTIKTSSLFHSLSHTHTQHTVCQHYQFHQPITCRHFFFLLLEIEK